MKLYFGSNLRRISTLLILVFFASFTYFSQTQTDTTRWGFPVFLMFALGLSMSIVSGFRDGMGKPASLIPVKHKVMTLLCLLGGVAFLVGIIALFYHRQDFLKLCFYTLSGIILVKVLITESFRIQNRSRIR